MQNKNKKKTQSVHEILNWVDKSDPLGPPPANPASDPQYNLWEVPVRAWAQANGYQDGIPVPVGAAPGTQTFSTSTQTF